MTPPSSNSFMDTIRDTVTQKSRVYLNVGDDYIVISENNLRESLRCHKDQLADSSSWQTPVLFLLTLASIFATADFKDALGVKAPTWEALHILLIILAVVWSFSAVIKSFKANPSTDRLVVELKKESLNITETPTE